MNPLDEALLAGKIDRYWVKSSCGFGEAVVYEIEKAIGEKRYQLELHILKSDLHNVRCDPKHFIERELQRLIERFCREVEEAEKNPI